MATLADKGNKVAKVKITPDPEETRMIVQRETIRAGEQYGVRFRYDANGALDKAGAKTVIRWLDHATTELLEQPLPVAAWQDMASLYASCPIPLMLDESIVDAGHVFLAAGCADYIKLKLAKNGSPSRLLELHSPGAREIGLKVVLGNGVQAAIGCWLEGQVQVLAGLDNPGEMNGFRKIRHDFLAGLFDATPTGFTTRSGLSWPALESKRLQGSLSPGIPRSCRLRLRQVAPESLHEWTLTRGPIKPAPRPASEFAPLASVHISRAGQKAPPPYRPLPPPRSRCPERPRFEGF